MSPRTSGRNVARTWRARRATVSSAASRSTPLDLYDSPTPPSALFEDGLRQRHGYRDGVFAGEAGRAEAGAGGTGGGHQPVEVEVGERVGADIGTDLVFGEARC